MVVSFSNYKFEDQAVRQIPCSRCSFRIQSRAIHSIFKPSGPCRNINRRCRCYSAPQTQKVSEMIHLSDSGQHIWDSAPAEFKSGGSLRRCPSLFTLQQSIFALSPLLCSYENSNLANCTFFMRLGNLLSCSHVLGAAETTCQQHGKGYTIQCRVCNHVNNLGRRRRSGSCEH